MYGDWFYTANYGIFGNGRKATKRSPPDNLTRCIFTQSKVFTRKGIGKISRSARAYFSLVLTSQVQARSSIVENSASAVDAQQLFKSTFKALINEDYSISTVIDRYQGVLEHALSKVDFSVGTGIYMLPSNLNLIIGKTVGYNNKTLISNTNMKTGSNKDINKDHKKLPQPEPEKAEGATIKTVKSTDKPTKDRLTAVSAEGQGLSQHDPVGHKAHQVQQTVNQRMLAERHNDEKLAITTLIVGAGLVAYYFW